MEQKEVDMFDNMGLLEILITVGFCIAIGWNLKENRKEDRQDMMDDLKKEFDMQEKV